jgi:hypothetical protein
MYIKIFSFIKKWRDYIFNNSRTALEYVFEAILIIIFVWFKYILDQDKINVAHIVIWFLITILLVIVIHTIKNTWRKRRKGTEDRLRYCLLNLRKIFTDNSQKIYELVDAVNMRRDVTRSAEDPEIQIRCRIRRYIYNMKKQVIEMIYNQLLSGGPIIGISYRVAIFEADNDNVMRIKLFANAEQSRPKVASLRMGFRMKEGVAGSAWYYKRPMAISDVSKYLNYLTINNMEELSMYKPLDDYTHSKIESIVCFPVVVRREGCETVEAIVSIDCDKKGEFDIKNNINEQRKLRMEIYPYIRLLAWIYGITNFFKGVLDIDVDSCDCPLCMTSDN